MWRFLRTDESLPPSVYDVLEGTLKMPTKMTWRQLATQPYT